MRMLTKAEVEALRADAYATSEKMKAIIATRAKIGAHQMDLGRPANEEMIQGYMDGLDPNNPEPSANRSHSYRHGFANGRDDRRGKPRSSFAELIKAADYAMAADDSV